MYWRREYFQTLKDVADAARQCPEWAEYANFCREYESGLREQAFVTLERFVSALERAPFSERRRFVSWLMHTTDGTSGRHMTVPHPLQLRVVEPTLVEWTAVDPKCSEPHRWLGGYEHLKSALEIDPRDELAIQKLIVLILGSVGTQELPDRYVGEPRLDLVALEEAEELLHGLSSDNERRQLAEAIQEERSLIRRYLRDA
jgi:hypothetical protein